ncbi:MAG: hypothetical protein QOG66_2045 [Methylobacteriaceae bacterium]|jgi:hypothetical protein|nr:hypothetical protein [Methylobacteriaceae bacterium]
MPIHVVILVCALRMQPSACTTETAIDVTQGPRVENELMCGKLGQGVLAGTALAPREGLEYVKIACVREHLASSSTLH